MYAILLQIIIFEQKKKETQGKSIYFVFAKYFIIFLLN